MADKRDQMRSLIEKMKLEKEIENIFANRKGKKVNVGLINHYKLHELIPNKWFDWVDRANAKIAIIGQDWGPYISLKKYVDEWELVKDKPDFDYNEFLFKRFSSRTERFIVTTLQQTHLDKFGKSMSRKTWDKLFFTMAVLFTRQGIHFRGSDNFDEKVSSKLSYPYLKQQLDIVKPKIIITLGNLAFSSINKYFNLGYEGQKISEIITSLSSIGYINSGDTIIIPNYHPAAHIDPKIMKRLWKIVWDHIEN
ncbi:hypothetical protein M0R04_00640 [Candidatus Dojkabacteria bacterium]|nr:hypothetical protein [Candidatus Dojkabacteria bacterium]